MSVRMKVIVRDIVAIWKGVPKLIARAMDDWADRMFAEERRREEKDGGMDG